MATASVVAGLDADTATPFLGLPKEGDLNVNVFDQGKLNAAFDRVDTFASLIAAAAAGDMLLDIDPAEDDDLVVPEADFSRVVTVRLVDSDDRIHTWLKRCCIWCCNHRQHDRRRFCGYKPACSSLF